METKITKAIKNVQYSFDSRFNTREEAKKVIKLNENKHAYYTKLTEKGTQYFDVRTEN